MAIYFDLCNGSRVRLAQRFLRKNLWETKYYMNNKQGEREETAVADPKLLKKSTGGNKESNEKLHIEQD